MNKCRKAMEPCPPQASSARAPSASLGLDLRPGRKDVWGRLELPPRLLRSLAESRTASLEASKSAPPGAAQGERRAGPGGTPQRPGSQPWGRLPRGSLQTGRRLRAEPGRTQTRAEGAASLKLPPHQSARAPLIRAPPGASRGPSFPARPQAKLLVRRAAPRFPRALLRGPSSPASPPPRDGGDARIARPGFARQPPRGRPRFRAPRDTLLPRPALLRG